ncbi:hypothetical protein BESB_035300 [Besnoitia besnoiti]|uniref:Exportin-T n=1 Tax=Besnoitia besnoiti TaxID=94643 RepID=A0A2A9MN74_BESBE|nr:hypothetical protein BESB_035300 [Besnoitia besnoiti]PFH37072.1 hypothetical protein BESB_035300 [Besnoitia besnoiti]
MENFEEAVQLVFAPPMASQSEKVRRERAQAYLDEILASPDCGMHLLQWLPNLVSVEARFWTLQTLLNSVMPASSSPPQRQAIREGLLAHFVLNRLLSAGASAPPSRLPSSASAALSGLGGSGPAEASAERREGGAGAVGSRPEESLEAALKKARSPEDTAVKNKTALLLVRLVQIDFPTVWPSAFSDLQRLFAVAVEAAASLPSAAEVREAGASAGPLATKQVAVFDGVEMCLRVLLVLHQEVVEDPVSPREDDQARRDAEIRATLRQYFASPEPSSAASLGSNVSFSPLLLQLLKLPAVREDASMLRLTCEIIGRYIGYMDLLLPPSTWNGAQGSTAQAESKTRPPTAVGEVDDDGEPATEGTLVHILLETWLTCSCEEAGNAVVAFAHKKMDAETKARLLSRMGLAEALRACTQQVAQRPELVAGFASLVGATAAAFLEAAHTLKQREKEGRASPARTAQLESEPTSGAGLQKRKSAAAGKDVGKAALMAWQRVDLLLPVIAELFACPVVDIAFRVEPFLSLFCNKTKLQPDLQKAACLSDFATSHSLSPFLTNMLQLLFQKVVALQSFEEVDVEEKGVPADDESEDEEAVKLQEYSELASQLYKRVFLVHLAHSFTWLQEMVASVCKRLAVSASASPLSPLPSSQSLEAASPSSPGSPLSASIPAAVWREVGAALQLLLLSAEPIKDLSRDLKDLSHPLACCLLSLVQTDALFRFSSASATPPPGVRILLLSVLVRFAPFFSHRPEFLPTALQFLLGPACLNIPAASLSAGLPHKRGDSLKKQQRRLSCVAGRSCLSLLRFLKNTQPQVNAFTVDILQVFQTEKCLDIPHPALRRSPSSPVFAAFPSDGAAERELEKTGAARVPNKLFTVDDQQLLFEAAGVLLGSRCTYSADRGGPGAGGEAEAPPASAGDATRKTANGFFSANEELSVKTGTGLRQDEKMHLLHQLLQHLVPAFDTSKLSEISTPEDAACSALWWARTCNAVASLTKSFPSCVGDGGASAPTGDRAREVWREAFQHISYATQVVLSTSLRPEISRVFLFSPFFHSFVFLLRRGLHLLALDILPVMSATLPLLYEALPSPCPSAASTRGFEEDCEAVRKLFAPAAAAAPCTPQGSGAQLASLVTYFLVTLKEKTLAVHGGFLSEELLRNIFWRHFALWWLAGSDSPEFLRDQAELQEQLTLLLCTVGKETPSLLAAFVSPQPVSASACLAAASSLGARVAASASPSPSPSSAASFRLAVNREVFVRGLQDYQQQLLNSLCSAAQSPTAPAPASHLSLDRGVIAAGLSHCDSANLFLASLLELFAPAGIPSASAACRFRDDQDLAHASRVGVSCFLLYSVSAASARNSLAALYALQAWLFVLHYLLDAAPAVPSLPCLAQIQALFKQQHARERQPAEAAPSASPLHVPSPDAQGKAAEELLRVLPAQEVFAATCSLLLRLDVAADAQQVRVLSDVCNLWRLFVLGPGGGASACVNVNRPGGASSLCALASFLPHFFQPVQRLLFSSLSNALYGFTAQRDARGAPAEELTQAASQAAAALVQNLVETADLRAGKENVRQWILAQRRQEK